MAELASLSWPHSRLAEALEALALSAGLPYQPSADVVEAVAPPEGAEVGRNLCALAAALGLEAESVEAPFPELRRMVRGAAPALLALPSEGPVRFLALVRGGRSLRVLSPNGSLHTVDPDEVVAALTQPLAAPLEESTERLLREASVSPRRWRRAKALLLSERLGGKRVGGVWLLRPGAAAGPLAQATRAKLPLQLAGVVGVHAAQHLLWVGSWWVVGRGALSGRLDTGWLVAWGLCLLTLVPLRALTSWLRGRVALGAGLLLKGRLLLGALRMAPDEVRRRGSGGLLAQVLESEAVESLALSGGLLSLTAVVELLVAALVLAAGAGGAVHVALLLSWLALLAWLFARYFGARRRWTYARLELTHGLVERMVGHRTRVAQQPKARWHDGEDEGLDRYLERARAMDRWAAALTSLGARGWLVLGALGLGWAFVEGSSPGALAAALGGVLLAALALQRLVSGGVHLCGASIAWETVKPLWAASQRAEPKASLLAAGGARDSRPGRPVLEARELSFRHQGRAEPVLRKVSLTIREGDRLLVEGASGGGKSTLAALLSNLRSPEAGLLLAGGLDVKTLGPEAWRRRVAHAPQFHENHVLTETFAFNLLMGREWPPRQEDLDEAQRLCAELGLGELLERMPAGLLQMVGEAGWQLSHGEKSRLYLARALLQGSELVILDESFAALDPENLERCLAAAERRARSLMVIAHP